MNHTSYTEVMSKNYGQFCGLAKASSLLGERWTLLVLRDLSVGPRRFKDLHEGLPGVPTSLLTNRLRDLEAADVVARKASETPGGGVLYNLTSSGEELVPILDAIGRWGARTMVAPEPQDVITGSSLAAALRAGYRPGALASQVTYQIQTGPAVAWAVAGPEEVTIGEGTSPTDPDMTIHGDPRLRLLLGGELSATEAIATGAVRVEGSQRMFDDFTRAFQVPLNTPTAQRTSSNSQGIQL